MIGVGFVEISSAWAAAGNLCMRKNVDWRGSGTGYLVSYYFFSFIAALLSTGSALFESSAFSPAMFIVGGVVGALNVSLMLLISQAIRLGPAGLSFAFVSAAAVIPSVLMPLVFGSAFGYQMTTGLLAGLTCILGGLFWAARTPGQEKTGSWKWLGLACSLLLVQGFILCVIEWRCLLVNPHLPAHSLIFMSCQADEEVWFMPGMFSVAFLIQSCVYGILEKRWLSRSELGFGSLGGLANGVSTYFLLLATSSAAGFEKGILFPCAAITTILLCNLWGRFLYQEKVNWKANALCCIGIVLGALK